MPIVATLVRIGLGLGLMLVLLRAAARGNPFLPTLAFLIFSILERSLLVVVISGVYSNVY